MAGLPFHFDLRAGCLVWCEVLKGQGLRCGDLCPSKHSDTYPAPHVRLSGEKKACTELAGSQDSAGFMNSKKSSFQKEGVLKEKKKEVGIIQLKKMGSEIHCFTIKS